MKNKSNKTFYLLKASAAIEYIRSRLIKLIVRNRFLK